MRLCEDQIVLFVEDPDLFGWEQIFVALAHQLLSGIAKGVAGRIVDEDHPMVAVLDEHWLPQRVQNALEEGLAALQRLLGALALGDVEDHADQAARPAVIAGERRLEDEPAPHRAVAPDHVRARRSAFPARP